MKINKGYIYKKKTSITNYIQYETRNRKEKIPGKLSPIDCNSIISSAVEPKEKFNRENAAKERSQKCKKQTP